MRFMADTSEVSKIISDKLEIVSNLELDDHQDIPLKLKKHEVVWWLEPC